MYFNNKNKIKNLKKKVVLTTLTATMLVSAFPMHQSSITIGSSSAYAAEPATTENTAVVNGNKEEYVIKIESKDLESAKEEFSTKADELNKKLIEKFGKEKAEAISNEIEKLKESVKSLEDISKISGDSEESLVSTLNKNVKEFIKSNSEEAQVSKMKMAAPLVTPGLSPEQQMQMKALMGEVEKQLGELQKKMDLTPDQMKEIREQLKLTPQQMMLGPVKIKALLEKKKAEIIEKLKEEALKKAIYNKKLIRIGGKNRRETALGISRAQFNSSRKIILVNQDSYADALTASVLAKVMDVPIILNSSKAVSPETMFELNRLKASEVLILGGESSISSNVENQLKGLKLKVERLAGNDRYDTSTKVAELVFEKSGNNRQAVIASGENFPDALAIAPLAGKMNTPILLVKKDEISKEVSDFLMYKSIKKTFVVGGKTSIGDSVMAKLPRVVERFAGHNRYETAEAIANYGYKDAQKIFVATGDDFADALAAGPMIANNESPLLLVGNKGFTKGTKKFVLTSKSVAMIFVGGKTYIPDAIESKLAEMPKLPDKKAEEAKKAAEAKKAENTAKAPGEKAVDVKKAATPTTVSAPETANASEPQAPASEAAPQKNAAGEATEASTKEKAATDSSNKKIVSTITVTLEGDVGSK